MNVEFLDPAESEFIEAIGYYNGESEGLGYEFATEVNRTIGRIMECRMRGHSYRNGLGGVGRTGSRMVLSTKSGATRS